jgi:hypothetical protein
MAQNFFFFKKKNFILLLIAEHFRKVADPFLSLIPLSRAEHAVMPVRLFPQRFLIDDLITFNEHSLSETNACSTGLGYQSHTSAACHTTPHMYNISFQKFRDLSQLTNI